MWGLLMQGVVLLTRKGHVFSGDPQKVTNGEMEAERQRGGEGGREGEREKRANGRTGGRAGDGWDGWGDGGGRLRERETGEGSSSSRRRCSSSSSSSRHVAHVSLHIRDRAR